MQALSDEQGTASLEKKIDEGFARVDEGFARINERFARVDEGFAEMRGEFKNVRAEMYQDSKDTRRELQSEILAARSEARSDFRLLLIIVLMYMTMIFGLAALLLQHHL